MTVQEDLPPYIPDHGHGEVSFEVPLQISSVTGYCFPLLVDRKKLQAFVDSQLNAASAPAVVYEADWALVLHCYLQALHCTNSATPPIGYLPDRESAFLVPLRQKRRLPDGSIEISRKIWVPYLFIDQISGMVTGREVWGYRKCLGTITLDDPADPAQPAFWSAESAFFRQFGTDRRGEWGPILQLRGVPRADNAAAPTSVAALLQSPAGWPPWIKPYWDEIKHLVQTILTLIERREFVAPVVNLKQFRDAVQPDRACYQALVASPCRIRRSAEPPQLLLSRRLELEVTQCASHQIVADLGLVPERQDNGNAVMPVLFGLRLNFDFTTDTGSIIWQASGRRPLASETAASAAR